MAENQQKIFVIDDDPAILELVTSNLELQGYQVESADNAIDGLALIQQNPPNLVILDLMMPNLDGFTACQRLRQNEKTKDIPVLMLTALSRTEDKVTGFDSGADDYLTKPFELKELCARIRACQRRVSAAVNSEICIGDLKLDTAGHKMYIKDIEVNLSRREFALLYKLVEMPGKVISRDILTQSIYGWGDDVDSNAIEVHIHNLRKKIGDTLKIKTIRGVGYIIEENK